MLTEGGNDAGVDGLHIGEIEDDEFYVTLFQGKYRVKGPERANPTFRKTASRRSWIRSAVLFDPYRAVVLNARIEPLVQEVRSLIRDGYIPTVRVVLCNNGARWTAQADAWIDDAKQSYGEQVEFLHFNHDAIVISLRRGDRIDAIVALSGQAIVEDMNYMRVLVGRVSVREIGRLFAEHGDQLLQRNIRRYLGHVNRVNSDIRATLLDPERSDKFYFYNNGITVVCDRFDYNALQRADYQVRLSNMQVINGGQTCKKIQQTLSVDGAPGAEDAYVMLRIYQLPDEAADVVQEITKATNSQNPVDLRDLRSNDEWQRALELGVEELGYEFKRHREEGGVGPGAVTGATVAEAVLAIWRERPHQAKFRRREHFGKLYETIFKDLNAAQALLATLIFRMVEGRRREGGGRPARLSSLRIPPYSHVVGQGASTGAATSGRCDFPQDVCDDERCVGRRQRPLLVRLQSTPCAMQFTSATAIVRCRFSSSPPPSAAATCSRCLMPTFLSLTDAAWNSIVSCAERAPCSNWKMAVEPRDWAYCWLDVSC